MMRNPEEIPAARLLAQARAAIKRVRELHQERGGDCRHDMWTWPCPTIQALDSPDQEPTP